MKPKIITWFDAEDVVATWINEENIEVELKKKCVVQSVGIIIGETKDYVLLASDCVNGNDKSYGRVMRIPKGCIVK